MLYKLYLTNLASTWSEWMNEWMNETFIYLKFTTFINDKYLEIKKLRKVGKSAFCNFDLNAYTECKSINELMLPATRAIFVKRKCT